MNTLRINILNPRALRLLQDLADLDLISIQDTSATGFVDVLKKLRAQTESPRSLDEITREVESIRARRHAR